MWLLDLCLETEYEEGAEVLMVCSDLPSEAKKKTPIEHVQALNDERSGGGPTGLVPASRTAGIPVAFVSDGRVRCGVGAFGSSGENSGP